MLLSMCLYQKPFSIIFFKVHNLKPFCKKFEIVLTETRLYLDPTLSGYLIKKFENLNL